jgi:GNAT superfamily N-acetyltransferase
MMSIDALKKLWKQAFGDDDGFLSLFFATAYVPQRCRYITVDGQLAAALYWFDCSYNGTKCAYIYAVATAPAFRGQGLCRRLMDDTHEALQAQNYAGAILVPGEPGLFEMYRKLGYRVMSGVESISCPAGAPTDVQEASIEAYAAKRRSLLPPGGVLQENENLRFLSGYARLYTGKDFALAALRDGEKLVGLKLLGNTDAAPGIVAALGCKEGRFRIPGSVPFAMYHPLSDTPAPTYFGLAFD